jgi:hypothetical protein
VTRFLSGTSIAFLVFTVVLALAAFAVRTGFMPDDTVTLWAGALAASEGEIPLGRIVAVYPSIPFLATLLTQLAMPAGAPTPALLSALLLAILAGSWFLALRGSGVGFVAAVAATVLVAFHPVLLRAAIAGPADMFLVLFLFLFGKGLYDLRARSTAPEVMAVALALAGLAFSHPMGAAIALASVPFLVLAVRPALVAKSAFNVVVALIFPAVFCVGAFSYVSWVFPGSGWSFFTAPSAALAGWSAGFARMTGNGLTGLLSLDAAIAVALALAIGAPAALAAIRWVHRRRPLVAPALVVIAATLAAAVLTVATGRFGEPAAVVVAAPVLCALAMIRIPPVRERMATVVPLLVLGWLGGAASLVAIDPRLVTHLRDALAEPGGDRERIDALNLGAATLGRAGVLVDTANAPAVVLGRGTARGLHAPRGETFALAMLFARFDTSFVAVPDPQSVLGAQDRLNKAFPQLFRFGAPGYRLVYHNSTWRLFARAGARQVRND